MRHASRECQVKENFYGEIVYVSNEKSPNLVIRPMCTEWKTRLSKTS